MAAQVRTVTPATCHYVPRKAPAMAPVAIGMMKVVTLTNKFRPLVVMPVISHCVPWKAPAMARVAIGMGMRAMSVPVVIGMK